MPNLQANEECPLQEERARKDGRSMTGRFVADLRAMRRGLSRTRLPLAVDFKRSRQYDLAARIASRNVDWQTREQEWDVFFRRALEEIQQQDREFEVRA